MARLLFYLVPALIISVSAAVYKDCEQPPSVINGITRIEDEEDTIRVIYSCQSGFELHGPNELLCDLDTDEWNGNPPECVQSERDNEIEDEDAENSAVKTKRKKLQDIPEDRMVSPALASTLDLSCIPAKVKAPEIRHGHVTKYDRRRRGDKIFLAAIYECNDKFEMEDTEINTLYCGDSKWVGDLPVCIYLGEDPEDEEEEYEEYGEETEEDNADKPEATTTNQTQAPEDEEKEISNEIPTVANQYYTSKVTNETEEARHYDETNTVTELPAVVEPTQDPYTPRVVDDDCGSDNGGCDQKCQRVLFPGENEPRIKCSCTAGFSLDPYDYSTCRDIDECAIRNGGCEQLCQNLPGSFQCICESGLQIDTLTGNTCIDINECELSEIAAECRDGCENTHGSYRCIEPLNNSDDARKSENASMSALGESSDIIRTSEKLECSNGYKAEDDKCVDIDECSEGTIDCEMRAFTESDFKCMCPNDFYLADDGKTCVGRMCSHYCQNTMGSFHCSCPERQHLLDDRRTCAMDTCSDLQNMDLNKTRCGHDCQDLVGGSYQCVCPEGFALTDDGINCLETVDVCAEHKDACAPGSCESSEDGNTFSCLCPLGYEEIHSRCVDIDECSRGMHKCSHECLNTEGNYRCECPAGLSFAEGSDYECKDIDECVQQPGICGTLNCVNLVGTFNCVCADGSEPNKEGICSDMLEDPCADQQCSHQCLIEGQGFRCACPGNMTLDDTGLNCVEADVCSFNRNGCEQICKSEEHGLCGCFDGFVLDGNGKSCIDIDECQIGNGGCHQLCTNVAGSYACACEKGFELAGDQKTCLDIDECALGRHDCSHECVNVDGGFTCTCREGYYLGETRSSCLDIDECIVMDHGCSHDCYNTQGSYMCSCPEDLTLSQDGRNCLSQNIITDNCGCWHGCDLGNRCVCPLGFSLAADGRNCEDIDECLDNNGFCLHKCHNTKGSFECRCPDGSKPLNGEHNCPITCPAGFTFSVHDPSKCEDIDECSLPDICASGCRNTNGSYECFCPSGYRLENGRECVDVNECLENNGGCLGGMCVNLNGGFECKCSWGYILSGDRKTCEKQVRDQCSPFIAPLHGEAHCSKYRHKSRRFYNTKCKVWCDQGYHLEGPRHRLCNASGQWDDYENKCLPNVCPRIPTPLNGIIWPQSCSLGTTDFGEQCELKCNVGFVPLGKTVTVCSSNMKWSYDGIFDCTKTHLSSISPHTFSDWNTNMPAGYGVQNPFIKCPRNSTVLLSDVDFTAHVILEKPLTNLDYSYIETSPAWGKSLQARLRPGSYTVEFRGQDPITGKKASCKTIINVRYAEKPTILYCTKSFDVQLAENKIYRSVVWVEPKFESKYGLEKIFKSKIPGDIFTIGSHTVLYEATSADGLTAKCEFTINVKAAPISSKPLMPPGRFIPNMLTNKIIQPTYNSGQRQPFIVSSPALLPGHESFIICPDQKPIKVTHDQTVELPRNCILKNIRLNASHQFAARHRFMRRLWNSYYY